MHNYARIFVNENHRSVCKNCFRTVGESIEQEELDAKEHAHICDWHDVLRYQLLDRPDDYALDPSGKA